MAELGTWLRETREAQGISLEEVEAQTRIRRAFLQALEEGEYDVLPGEVYVRGFLRNYALYLSLDPEEVRHRYNEETLSQGQGQRTQHESEFRPIDAALEPLSHPIRTLVTRLAIALPLLIGALSVGVWYRYGRPLPQPPAWWPPHLENILPPPASPLQSFPTSTPPIYTSTPVRPSITPAPTRTLTSSPPPTAIPSPAPPTPTSKPIATSAVLPLPTLTPVPTATPTPTSTPLSPSSENQGIKLRVQAIERAWVLITVDGEEDFQGVLEEGGERTWQAEHSIHFRCGNAGGVQIDINGEELGIMGERGQVVDRTWVVQEGQLTTATPSS